MVTVTWSMSAFGPLLRTLAVHLPGSEKWQLQTSTLPAALLTQLTSNRLRKIDNRRAEFADVPAEKAHLRRLDITLEIEVEL